MVPNTHEQNIICSKTRLDGTTHEQTIICRQLFAGHVVGSRPMERKEKMHRMIITVILRESSGMFTFKSFDFHVVKMFDYRHLINQEQRTVHQEVKD